MIASVVYSLTHRVLVVWIWDGRELVNEIQLIVFSRRPRRFVYTKTDMIRILVTVKINRSGTPINACFVSDQVKFGTVHRYYNHSSFDFGVTVVDRGKLRTILEFDIKI